MPTLIDLFALARSVPNERRLGIQFYGFALGKEWGAVRFYKPDLYEYGEREFSNLSVLKTIIEDLKEAK